MVVKREAGAERWACLLAGQSRADRFCALPSITRAAAAHFSFSFSFNIYDLFMCGCLLVCFFVVCSHIVREFMLSVLA